jgi:rhamnulokinase
MGLNASTHLFAMNQKYPDLLKQSTTLFMVPDFFYFLLTNQKITEYTNASTTQLLDAKERSWSTPLLKKLGLSPSQFPPLHKPGTTLGSLSQEVQELTQLNPINVQIVATHDTASAIAAIPHTDPDKSWAYISSGTWSLLGVELPEPLISDEVRAANLTNEGGVEGTIRFLKNIMGLWLIQRCKSEWDIAGEIVDYNELTTMAEEATPFQSIIFPDDARFFNPKSMINEIASFCEETNQPIPQSKGEFARCIFESLACRYREVLENIEQLTGTIVDQLHIVGGGSKNRLLSQFTADVLQKEVITGPVECTAIGNIMMQAKAAGIVEDLPAIRQIVKNSFPIESIMPNENWDDHYAKYLSYRQ